MGDGGPEQRHGRKTQDSLDDPLAVDRRGGGFFRFRMVIVDLVAKLLDDVAFLPKHRDGSVVEATQHDDHQQNPKHDC